MTDETLFELPPLTPGYLDTSAKSELSADARRTERNRRLLDGGTHPATGLGLLASEWGYTCGDCSHAVKIHHHNRSFWKCERHRLGMSRSAASDIRVSWPACTAHTQA